MSIAEQAPAQRPPEDQRFVLYGVNWRIYETLLEAIGDRPIHLTYDRGTLEIMTLSFGHEWWRRRIGLSIDTLAVELGLDIQGGGSTTFKRRDLDRGLEPDECYYIANEPRIRGKKEIDLSRDPPPDLAVEVELTASVVDRPSLYAALRVPELWRFDGENLRVYRLTEALEYEVCQRSQSFPMMPMDEFVPFLMQNSEMSESAFVRSFREWVRQRILPATKSNGPEGK